MTTDRSESTGSMTSSPAPSRALAGSLHDDHAARVHHTVSVLREVGYDSFIAVPCGVLAPLLRELEDEPGFYYAPREDTAVAAAAGASMAASSPLALMQNSGLGQSVNALASLLMPYQFPVSLMVSLRGTDEDGTAENQAMGGATEATLIDLGIPTRTISPTSIERDVHWLAHNSRGGPAALLVAPSFFGWSPTR